MYIPEKMKVNKFHEVAIPSNKSFFSRFGNVNPETLQYTGDEVAPEPMRKTDSINDYIDYAELMSRLDEPQKT